MVAKKEIACPNPKCSRIMKSTSGWTLHVKTCCPELRWRKTVVKMEVEFEIPQVMEDSLGPIDLHSHAFWPQDVRGVGSCKLVHAILLDVTTATRDATPQEKNRIKRAEALRDKGSATREFQRIVKEIVGVCPQGLVAHTTTNWPNSIAVTFQPPGLKQYEKRHIWKYAFTLDLKKTNILVALESKKKSAVVTPWVGPNDVTCKGKKTFRLADPKCFEDIRNYTGLRP